MMTSNPEADFQSFIKKQKSRKVEVETCAHCGNEVPAEEIKWQNDYMCETYGCSSIDFCDCGEPRSECKACK